MNRLINFSALLQRIFTAVIIFVLLSFASGEKGILWDSARPLTWADFRGQAPGSSASTSRVAMTYSSIALDFEPLSETSYSIHVNCTMEPARSWVYQDKKDEYILRHEQYHFNITECAARKMRKEISGTKFSMKNLQQKIKAIHTSNMEALKAMQDQYDADSRHSINHEEQKKWEEKIDKLMASLEDYANPNVVVMLK